MLVGLVGCVKSKRHQPAPAKELYTSPLFVGRRRFVEARCDRWFVLSALYGLVDPDEVIEPYDVGLTDQDDAHRRAWARQVVAELKRRMGTLRAVDFEIHAGAAYRDHGLAEALGALGASIECPTEGLDLLRQLAFYRDAQPAKLSGPRGYSAIRNYLQGRQPPLVANFDEVAAILGRPLPPSALRHREWWANTDRSPQGRGWLAAGWSVKSVDLAAREVTFTSLVPAGVPAAIPPKDGPVTDALPQKIRVIAVEWLGPFSFRWPDATEQFGGGWEASVQGHERRRMVKLGLGHRVVFGADRPHAVVFVDGAPVVEGSGTDDYAVSRTLVSMIKRARRDVVDESSLPAGYEELDVVRHREVVTGPGARQGLAVRLREDDFEGWVLHALLRMREKALRSDRTARSPVQAHATPMTERRTAGSGPADPVAVVTALLDHGARIAAREAGQLPNFTGDPAADELLVNDPFALLVAVIADQGIRAERAWRVPFELRNRLGYLEPERVAAAPEDVARAFAVRPALHRLVNTVPRWVHSAAVKVVEEYGGDASAIWGDEPTARELQARLVTFDGISQKKAAMATEILERDLSVIVRELDGSDVAYDVHLRRVFLRCGLAERDDLAHMVEAARRARPARPGRLDFPAWDIGRRWCRPTDPKCDQCAISRVCPRLVGGADDVRGM